MLSLESGGAVKIRRGFSLIELLISLCLFSVVMALIFTFFTHNLNSYRKAHNSSEIQFQAQYILNFMTGKILSSNSISLVKPNDVTIYSLTVVRSRDTDFPVKKISFKYGEREDENYIFHIMNNNIRYGNGKKDINPTVELGNYVEEMYISLMKDESFGEAKFIRLKIVMEKDGQRYEAFQGACMRNN
ncbi:MAG TPA: prepilin-type N-terminal cleavage/methylation domain-containing protein [Tissierellia bacterium]|nr:prepilin-type N-terminal cleavage/methylation domain-containing protein [Tissierellia bacterium]